MFSSSRRVPFIAVALICAAAIAEAQPGAGNQPGGFPRVPALPFPEAAQEYTLSGTTYPRGAGRQRARESVEPDVPAERRHARHRTPRPPAHRPQRHARSAADCRRSRGLGDRTGRTAGGAPPSAVQREPLAVHHLLEAVRHGRDDRADARHVRRQGDHRGQGSLRRRQLQYRQSALRIEARIRRATARCS